MLQQFPDGSFEQYQLLCSPALLQEQLLQQRDQVLFEVMHSSIESLLKAALSADCPENGTDDHGEIVQLISSINTGDVVFSGLISFKSISSA